MLLKMIDRIPQAKGKMAAAAAPGIGLYIDEKKRLTAGEPGSIGNACKTGGQ